MLAALLTNIIIVTFEGAIAIEVIEDPEICVISEDVAIEVTIEPTITVEVK